MSSTFHHKHDEEWLSRWHRATNHDSWGCVAHKIVMATFNLHFLGSSDIVLSLSCFTCRWSQKCQVDQHLWVSKTQSHLVGSALNLNRQGRVSTNYVHRGRIPCNVHPHTSLCTLFTLQCTLFTSQCTLFTSQCTQATYCSRFIIIFKTRKQAHTKDKAKRSTWHDQDMTHVIC